MKYLDEYRDAGRARALSDIIHAASSRPHCIMEVCGGQTHSIIRFGIDEMLPAETSLVHGPGCPVCVTPVERIDAALELAARGGIIFTTFGDMLRVPGSTGDLFHAKAQGADVRMVYSPLDSVAIARENPEREVVFFAVGFETTAPAHALALLQAAREGLPNFSLLTALVCVPPAIEAILNSPDNRVEGFLAAGHVCTVMGYDEYERLAHDYRVPIVVTGFEPVDILHGVLHCVRQLEAGETRVENLYPRAVQRGGNQQARAVMQEVFEAGDREWRGLGRLPQSGLHIRDAYAQFDAAKRFALAEGMSHESPDCHAGAVLRGVMKPHECPAFASLCTPETPLGAPMVSNEGACAAYYRYRGAHV